MTEITNSNTMNINNLDNTSGVVGLGVGVENDGKDETYIVEELKKYMFNNANLDDINKQKEK